MKRKYRLEKSFLGDCTIIYDEYNNKVGYVQKALIGDHINIYDSNGYKVGENFTDILGNSSNYYLDDPYAANKNYSNPGSTISTFEVKSSTSTTSVTSQELNEINDTSYTLSEDEAVRYGILCAELLKEANVKPDQTTFIEEKYEVKEHYGFLNLRTQKVTKTRYIPVEKCWILKENTDTDEYNYFMKEDTEYNVLTVNGDFYSGEIRKRIPYGGKGETCIDKNEWKKIDPYFHKYVIPLLDLFLKKNNISMSSKKYWLKFHK